MKQSELLYDVHENPPMLKWIILAFQHVFAMFGATVLVPILVNTAAGAEILTIPVALFSSGLGTLLYILCTRGKAPVYLGGSFAYIAPLAAAYLKGGIAGALTGIMLVGIIYMIIAVIIKYVGKSWIDKLLPPIVIGPMIMIIGLGLAPSAIGQIGLSGDGFAWRGIVVALISFLTTVIVMMKAKGFLKVIPFLIGIVAGYVSAILLGLVDFSPIVNASIIGIPKFKFPFIHYIPSLSAALAIIPIGIVTLAEHVGDHSLLGTIINRDLLKDPGLDKTILGDGVATFVAGCLGSSDTTTYGENIGVVGMTKVASVGVVGLAAVFAIILAFFAKFTALINTIPACVLGGIAILLFGFIASNGIRILVNNKVDFGKNRNIIISSAMLVLGLGGATLSFATGDVDISFSSMSLAAIVGVLLNLLLPEEVEENNAENITTNIDKENDRSEKNSEAKTPIVLDHPLIEHKVTILRDKRTGTKEFRELVSEIGAFLCYEAMKDATLEDTTIETPMQKMKSKKLNEDKYAFLPILRAGTGMLDGLIKVIPNAKIGHIGMYRNEETLTPVRYFYKVPKDIQNREVLILDPMLATGGSACDAIEQIKGEGVKDIKFLCLIAAPEGIEKIQDTHPDVQIYCAAIDEKLNEMAYILPGLGDAGDRIFGTK